MCRFLKRPTYYYFHICIKNNLDKVCFPNQWVSAIRIMYSFKHRKVRNFLIKNSGNSYLCFLDLEKAYCTYCFTKNRILHNKTAHKNQYFMSATNCLVKAHKRIFISCINNTVLSTCTTEAFFPYMYKYINKKYMCEK